MPTEIEAVIISNGVVTFFHIQRNVAIGKKGTGMFKPWTGKNKGPRRKHKPKP
jgi:hypothetical protein